MLHVCYNDLLYTVYSKLQKENKSHWCNEFNSDKLAIFYKQQLQIFK